MLCPRCDTNNDAASRFCRVCGTSLAGPEPSGGAARPVYTIGAAREPECPACGRSNPVGARFCVFCATALATPYVPAGGTLRAATAGPQPVYNVTIALADPSTLLVRAIWFVLIGWWLGLIWTIFAWLFNLTLIGLPVGLMMLHVIPTVMTLQPRPRRGSAHVPTATSIRPLEHPLPLRAIWFVLVGWWASLLWMIIAWSFAASLILMPISFWMFNRVPTILTLAQEP